MKTIQARYRGTCAVCGQPFPKGTMIRWARGYAAHAHEDECDVEGAILRAEAQDAVYGDEVEWRTRASMDAEIAAGVARAEHIRDCERFLGAEYAAAEELAWELRDPSY